jgi:transposase-like protein
MSQKRRRYSAKEKMTALRKHFVEGVPVSDICEELGIQPSLFYDWQRVLFSSAEQVFNRQPEAGLTRHVQEVSELKSRLRQKDEVLAEVMAEYVALKKTMGRFERRLGGH